MTHVTPVYRTKTINSTLLLFLLYSTSHSQSFLFLEYHSFLSFLLFRYLFLNHRTITTFDLTFSPPSSFSSLFLRSIPLLQLCFRFQVTDPNYNSTSPNILGPTLNSNILDNITKIYFLLTTGMKKFIYEHLYGSVRLSKATTH